MTLESIGYFRLGASAVIMLLWTGIVWFTATQHERDRVAAKITSFDRALNRHLH
jgi:hypothetical protein